MEANTLKKIVFSEEVCLKTVIKMGRVGPIFKRARLQSNIKIHQVFKALNIRENYLRAIEDDNLDVLPQNRSYTLGFVRTYANFLKLNPDEIVALFKKQHFPSPSLESSPVSEPLEEPSDKSITEHVQVQQNVETEEHSQAKNPSLRSMIWSFVGVSMVMGALYGINYFDFSWDSIESLLSLE